MTFTKNPAIIAVDFNTKLNGLNAMFINAMFLTIYCLNLKKVFQWVLFFCISMGTFLCADTAQATYPPMFSDCLQGDGEEYDQLDACQQLIRSNAKNYELRVALGKTLDKRQKYKQAVIAYKKALIFFPNDSYFLKKQSIAKSNLKEQQWLLNKKQGVAAQSKKTPSSEEHVQFKINKIRCTRLTGKKALKACNQAIKINNKDAALFISKGDIFASQQKNKQAIIVYQKAVKLNPKDKKTVAKLNKLRQSQKRLKQQKSRQKIVKTPEKTIVQKPVKSVKAKTAIKTKTVKTKTVKTQSLAKASSVKTEVNVLKPEQQQFIEQLNLLKTLKEQEIISQAEYEKRKMDLLDNTFKVSTRSDLRDNNKAVQRLKSKNTALTNLNFGNYYALIIGNNQYQHLNSLETAVNDAQALAEVLQQQYGFKVKLLLNASRYETLKAMGEFRNTLSKNDNLLIYYAGHGVLDKASERGYWLPVDAELDFTANWISTAEITDTLKALQSWHVLVMADSCYSGTLARSAAVKLINPEEKNALIKRLLEKKSRTVITSGGLEPVTDSGRDNHSVFAAAFLDVLENTKDVIEAESVFTQIRDKVILNADQTPEYSDVRKVGHNGGDFIFLRQ